MVRVPEKQSRDLTHVKERRGTKGRLSFLNGTPAVGTAFLGFFLGGEAVTIVSISMSVQMPH